MSFDSVEVPEEAIEALQNAEWAWSCSPVRPDRDSVEYAKLRLKVVAPFIRSQVLAELQERAIAPELLAFTQQQERQRVREAAKAFFAQEFETAEAVGSRAEVDRTRSLCEGLLAALDSLEDGDGACHCSYDRLVTEPQAFAIRSTCPVHGTAPDSNTREEAGDG